ncbi:hypothetical protein Back11_30060 [Paenibacillus baekrokdamisoli]|uniref:Inositolphosphotransferase Aur1/Ipt1 domain-containing protein n=1 Tax=Paenibacillus baekrokdamisoli TaxID=1712516 RepID=A0A3G9J7A3_9BACL|nr:hypothetical protein Back11_30060 [Paenibacillus baekrokdamisoli]
MNICYGLLNHGGSDVASLMTDLDKQIPFVPAFIVPYVIWYPFIFTILIVLFVKSRRAYYRTLLTLCLGLIGCYIIYYFFQTTVPRPVITSQGVFDSLVQFIYNTDGPYNCFPSIHVLTSYLMIKGLAACTGLSRTSQWLITLTSWSIILSTLFVKQHVLLDLIGAILLSELLTLVVDKWLLPSAEYGLLLQNKNVVK